MSLLTALSAALAWLGRQGTRALAASVNTRLRVTAAAAGSTSNPHGSNGLGIWMGQCVRSPTNTADVPASSHTTDEPGVCPGAGRRR